MKLQIPWYPWNVFVRRWELVTPAVFGVFVSLVSVVYALMRASDVPQPLFLHYSTELGVDATGPYWAILALPVFLFLISVVNTIIANVWLLRSRFDALVVLWSIPPLTLLGFWFLTLILRVNGV